MNESCWGGRLQCSAGTKETNTNMMVMMSMMRMRMGMMNKMLWDESVRQKITKDAPRSDMNKFVLMLALLLFLSLSLLFLFVSLFHKSRGVLDSNGCTSALSISSQLRNALGVNSELPTCRA